MSTGSAQMFFESLCTLSESINDNMYMFFAPRERFTSRRVLHMYRKYQEWYSALPPSLHLPDDPNIAPEPIVAVLQYVLS